MSNDTIDEESFQNGLFYLRKALRLLAADPATQCDEMGNHNVAWELRDDVLSGVRLLVVADVELRDQQGQSLWRIANSLRTLDDQILASTTDRDSNLTAMRNDCWVPIRAQAADLLAGLPKSRFEADEAIV